MLCKDHIWILAILDIFSLILTIIGFKEEWAVIKEILSVILAGLTIAFFAGLIAILAPYIKILF